MRRFAIILCFISRVIYGTYTVQHHIYSQHVSRKSRSNSPTLENGYVYNHIEKKPVTFHEINHIHVDPYAVNQPFELKSAEKTRMLRPHYEDVIKPYTIAPSRMKSEVDYEISKSAANARYDASRIKSDGMFDKLKALMHYHPPPDVLNDMITGYDSSNDFHMDDDDIRTSSRSLYDNWPYFYHSPYEYEHNKDVFDVEKAKDKRYVADGVDTIIPVHEVIEENDSHMSYEQTPKYFHEVTDNPIGGDAPFFSFVLNDYFERSGEEDPVVFKGLDWGKDFDHDAFMPEMEDIKRNRRLENGYFTTAPPVTNHIISTKLSQTESVTESGGKKNHEFDKHENGSKKNSDHKSGYENKANRFNGFKDFIDTFANKFGSEDHKKKSNYIYQVNQDKGENKKGFRRVYHKDEYQEDNEFYDNNNKSTKGEEVGGSNVHVGGSEAHLRSQAVAATGNEMKAANNSGQTSDKKFENSHKGHDRFNTLQNQFNRYIDVAKKAAQSNNADYVDHYRI